MYFEMIPSCKKTVHTAEFSSNLNIFMVIADYDGPLKIEII